MTLLDAILIIVLAQCGPFLLGTVFFLFTLDRVWREPFFWIWTIIGVGLTIGFVQYVT